MEVKRGRRLVTWGLERVEVGSRIGTPDPREGVEIEGNGAITLVGADEGRGRFDGAGSNERGGSDGRASKTQVTTSDGLVARGCSSIDHSQFKGQQAFTIPERQSGLSTCPSVRVSCPSVRVSWTGLSSVRLALGLPQGKLQVTLAYVADTSHSKLAPRMHEHAPRLTRRRL